MKRIASGLIGVLCCGLLAPGVMGQVAITEIMYHPASQDDGDEFIELYNSGGTGVALDGWCFNGISFCFPPSTSIGAGQRLVLAPDGAQFLATYGLPADFIYTQVLDDNGERLELLDDLEIVQDSVPYSDRGEWPVTPDGLGPSLEVIDPTQANDIPRNWRASTAGATPKAVNSVNATGLPPWITAVTHPAALQPSDPILVTATVVDATSVTLTYRLDFGGEAALAMLDDGASGDGAAGDDVYGATIPGQPAGTLVRYRIHADGSAGVMDSPRVDDTVTYGGTAVIDSALASNLETLHWFMDPADYQDAFDHKETDDTEPAVLFYDGKLYDGLQVRLRGQSARSFPKPPWKFFFPQGHEFEAEFLERSVDNFNLQSGYADKSLMREALAWETLRDSGAAYLQTEHVRVQRNGAFDGLYTLLEAPDLDFLRRSPQISDTAAHYKAFDDCRARPAPDLPMYYEKETRLEEPYTDLDDFLTDLNGLTGSALDEFLFDNVDVPALVNYIAALSIFHNNDHISKNFFLYRDSDGTQRWGMHAWDLDLTFGRNFTGSTGLNDDIWADVDVIPGQPSVSPSHPLFGDSEHAKVNGGWNRFIDRILGNSRIQSMYYRRLRSLMDQLLVTGRFEKRIDELAARIGPDAALDKAMWTQYGTPQTLAQAVDALKNDYLVKRRVHLFSTHATCDIPGPQTPQPTVVINEIMYKPSGGGGGEYVELYNPSATDAVDVSGWRLDGVALTLPAGSVILPDDYLLVVRDDPQFRAIYGAGKYVAAQYAGSLSNSGESVVLRTPSGAVIASVAYGIGAPWPAAANGAGASLELIDPLQANGKVGNWAASTTSGGTPAAANSVKAAIAPIPSLWINEVLPVNTSINQDESLEYDPWIEIYNASLTSVLLDGMYLSDNLGLPMQWAIPGGTSLCGGCWLLVWADGQTGQGPLHAGFTLGAGGGVVGLFAADGSIIDALNYGALAGDLSRGRFADGEADQFDMTIVTPASANQLPVSPLILNEYNAVAPDEFLASSNSDSYWGRVLGNGGNWLELVVTQDHLDVRDWELVMSNDTGGAGQSMQSVFFPDQLLWSDLRAGSIITVSEALSTDPGYFPPAGDWWINLQAPGIETSNESWQLTVKDDLGLVVHGPTGEGIVPVSGVGNEEVFKLEEAPGPYLLPTADYNAGTSSTFGAPNVFSAGSQVQDFSTLRAVGLSGTCAASDSDADSICDPEDNCPANANANQADGDGDGIGDVCDTCPLDVYNDVDLDTICGDTDNCPFTVNMGQADGDADGVGDVCDNCPTIANSGQEDSNGSGLGDACDICPNDPGYDADGDSICGDVDNCPAVANPAQVDSDGDGIGDACDACPEDADDDADLDGVCADVDVCPALPDPGQEDTDSDGVGDLCDNCLTVPNAGQGNIDGDGLGDACDDDDDNDGVGDASDNCAEIPNREQEDNNTNGVGDACDPDDDDDGVPDVVDNCVFFDNAGQADADSDGVGDDCDCDVANPSLGSIPLQFGASLRLDRTGGATLSWTRGPRSYVSNVYRGTFGGGQPWAYNETCFDLNLALTTTVDSAVPSAGAGYYYLIGGENTCGNGPSADPVPGGDHFPPVACAASSGDDDSDGVPDARDNCVTTSNSGQADADADFVGNACDNCPVDANADQLNLDGDGSGDVCDSDDDGDGAADTVDNCPRLANAGQGDHDGDGLGDACDTCTDADGDGLGDAGFSNNICPGDPFPDDRENDADGDGLGAFDDNCDGNFNPDQADLDLDGIGDVCDGCPQDAANDVDGDAVCAGQCGDLPLGLALAPREEVVLVESGAAMTYLANAAHPGIDLSWTLPAFDDSGWSAGNYGVGYEAAGGAENLLQVQVPVGTRSIYTRTTFTIADVNAVTDLFIGGDYDDAFVVWINGMEVYRSPEMPSGTPEWNTQPTSHESSNGAAPDYEPLVDVSSAGIPVLQNGTNTLAVGVWNHVPFVPPSDDLVLVPRLSINRTATMTYLANSTDPALGTTWVAEFFDDSGWAKGTYGVGFDNSGQALQLLQTIVPPSSRSVYTRTQFYIEDTAQVSQLFLGMDYDDGVVAWINGTEVLRYNEMPSGPVDWDTLPTSHESSNGAVPNFDPAVDISVAALPLLHNGVNALALGVWNDVNFSPADLVLFPSLAVNGLTTDNCPTVYNPAQSDADSDGVGDACDICVNDFDAQQADSDSDGLGDACDNCPFVFNAPQIDGDADGVGDLCDNCPATTNSDQTDSDGDGTGDACDTALASEMEPNDDCMTGNTLVLDQTILASLSASEYDYFQVTLTQDVYFQISTSGDPAGDTVVGVFDTNGTQLVGCDDDTPTAQDYYSAFSCCLPAGTYCVGVKGFAGDPIANYAITASSGGSCSANPDPLMNNCVVENTHGACVPF